MKRFVRRLYILLAIATLAGVLTIGVSAKGGTLTTAIGIVNTASLRLRSGPSTATSTIGYARKGDYALITGRSGSWYKVLFNLKEGYMHADYLDSYSVRDVELGYGSVNGTNVNVRSGASTSHSVVTQVNTGVRGYIIGFNKQWYKVIIGDHIGYIRSDFLDLTEIPYENYASQKKPLFFIGGKSTGISPSPQALNGNTGSSAIRQQIVTNAKKYLGTPYVWGGTTPKGFDCSGFVQYVMKQSGISLPRTTTEQYKIGTYVSKSNLQPGDLVFLQNTYREGISHVGIYIGNGEMIHASSSKGVVISKLSSSYYTQHYYGSRRVI